MSTQHNTKISVIQKITDIISNANMIIKDSIDPNDNGAILNAKLGMIDTCIKTLAKEIDTLNPIISSNKSEIDNLNKHVVRLNKIVDVSKIELE